MTESYGSPKRLCHQNRPHEPEQPSSGVIFRHQKYLVARNSTHGCGMPLAERGATHVTRDGVRNIAARIVEAGASQAQFYILQIRFESFIQEADVAKQLRPKKAGRSRRKPDLSGARKFRTVRPAVAHPPGACPPADPVLRSIDRVATGSAEKLAGREPHARRPRGFHQALEPIGRRFHVAIDDGQPRGGAFSNSAVVGAAGTSVRSHT